MMLRKTCQLKESFLIQFPFGNAVSLVHFPYFLAIKRHHQPIIQNNGELGNETTYRIIKNAILYQSTVLFICIDKDFHFRSPLSDTASLFLCTP